MLAWWRTKLLMGPRQRATPEDLEHQRLELSQRLKSKARDYTLRNCTEFLGTYLVGFLPMAMHGFVWMFAPTSDTSWVRAEAWLFVMIICAALFGDVWQERRRDGGDGTTATLMAFFGALGTIAGALGYALLTLRPSVPVVLAAADRSVWWIVGLVAVVYFFYRLPTLRREATEEAERKIALSAKSRMK